jgi:RNA polymerase primary sigma factor
MTSKTNVTPQKEEVLIRTAKKRAYVTHDQINSVSPSEEVNSEQIEDVLAQSQCSPKEKGPRGG